MILITICSGRPTLLRHFHAYLNIDSDVCQKLFNNYSVMVVHKRLRFGERPYKCIDCGDRFACSSQLKTYYEMHKQQNLHVNDNDLFGDSHSLGQNRLNLEKSSLLRTDTAK